MKNEYEKFLKWANNNDIVLYEYQKQLIKTFFENKVISIPRQYGRRNSIELVTEFYKSIEQFK